MAETFEGDLSGAEFREVNLTGARIRDANLTGLKISNAWCINVDIDALIGNFVVNGVDIVPYVNQELDKRYPIRTLLKPTDPEGMRAAWKAIEDLWATTVDGARALPEDKLHASVEEEWSFVETLRHLVFAMDKWFTSPVLGDKYDPIGLANTGTPDLTFLGIDHGANPTFEETLAVRARRMTQVREYLEQVTAADLQGSVPVLWSGDQSVQACLHVVFDEEFEHNRYATRDLAILSR